MFVQDLKNSELNLPEWFLKEVPERCPICGAPMEIEPSLTDLRCSDFMCKSNKRARIERLLKCLGEEVNGEELDKLVEDKDIVSVFDIFLYSDDELRERIKDKNRMYVWQYLNWSGIDNCELITDSYFGKEHTLKDVYQELDDKGLGYFNNQDTISFDTVKIYVSIRKNRKYLEKGVDDVRFI